MLNLTKTVLKRPIAVITIIAGLFIFGISSVLSMPLKLIPDMSMPMLLIQTVYPQAGPEEVERLVSKEIEAGCGSISGLDTTTTYSSENMSMVLLQFDYGTDLDDAYMDVQSAINRTKSRLPETAKDPVIMEMDVNSTPVINLAVNSLNGDDVTAFVDEVFKEELEKIGTVAQVTVAGGKDSYISVELIPERLSQYGLNISSVATTVASSNLAMPAGTKEYGDFDIDVATKTEYKTPTEIGTIPITTATGNIIHLSDIASIHYAVSDQSSYSRYNGEDNVSISIVKEQSASAVTVSKDVKAVIEEMKAMYPDYDIIIQYDSADSITDSIWSIFETLIFGIFITMVVLFLFFGDFKGSLIVGSSMPISLLLTFILMSFMGFSLNIVTMGALVIAIGMMVDNSIVVIEMCFRKRKETDDYEKSAFDAVKVVLNSVIASTITTVVVYLPLSLMNGLVGQMFGQLGFTIVFALCASLISSITIVPLCFKYYKPVEKENAPVSKLLEKVGEFYKKVIRRLLKRKVLTAISAVIIFIISAYLVQFVNSELMPSTDEGLVQISVTFRPGTNKDIVDAKIRQIEDFVASYDFVEGHYSSVQTATGTVNAVISSESGLLSNEVVDEWIDDIEYLADNCEIGVTSSSTSMSLGSTNAYSVTYESSDIDVLKQTVNELSDIMMSTEGVSSVSSSFGNMSSKAEIHVDPIKAAANGLTPQIVAGTIYTATNGTDAFESSIDGKTYQVKVEFPKDRYETVNDIYGMTIMNTRGVEVPLSDIADIVYTDTPEQIQRSNGRYVVTLSATMKSTERFNVQDKVEENLANFIPPQGVEKASSMTDKMMTEEFSSIYMATITAIILVFMVMAIEFENLVYSTLVMFCMPFAIIGSLVFLIITGQTFSMTSLMGFLMLVGIVVNNGILYVDYANQLRAEGWETKEALVETGASRLRPILMTTLTTIISMLPFVFGIGKNSESMQGMALVICGGLIASTILTLLMIPVFYLVIADRQDKKKAKKAARRQRREEKKLVAKSRRVIKEKSDLEEVEAVELEGESEVERETETKTETVTETETDTDTDTESTDEAESDVEKDEVKTEM